MSMNGSYAETSVKRKATLKSYAIKAGLIGLTFFSVLLTFGFLGMLSVIIGMVLILVCVFVFPYLDVEYEYVFCDGQIDFDKIFSGNKRKTAKRIDFENVEMMAPVNSHTLDGFKHQQCKTLDFTSGEPDRRIYVIYVRNVEEITRILFEPDDKMIEAIKQKAPRKFSEY